MQDTVLLNFLQKPSSASSDAAPALVRKAGTVVARCLELLQPHPQATAVVSRSGVVPYDTSSTVRPTPVEQAEVGGAFVCSGPSTS